MTDSPVIPARLRVGPVIEAVDAHAAGEPGRVIVGGVSGVPGAHDVRGDDLAPGASRRPAPADAARAARLPGRQLQPDPAVVASREPTPGYVIMEQVEYPGMSGTNTMCVVTVLLETGMLPMTEPVTELTLEAPAGLIRVTRRLPRRQGHGGHVPQRAGLRDPPRAPVEVPHLGTVTVDVAYGGMFYVIADAEPFGLRLTPDEGADIVRITEMIKAAANEQLPVVHPEQPGFAGITIGQLSGPAHDPANSRAQRRHRLDRDARLGAAGDLDRRDRPLAVRDRDLGQDGDAPRARAAARRRRRSATRGSSARSSPGRVEEETSVGPYRAIVPTHHRPGLDHRLRALRRRPDRPVPRRLHGRRHLVARRSAQPVAAIREAAPRPARPRAGARPG